MTVFYNPVVAPPKQAEYNIYIMFNVILKLETCVFFHSFFLFLSLIFFLNVTINVNFCFVLVLHHAALSAIILNFVTVHTMFLCLKKTNKCGPTDFLVWFFFCRVSSFVQHGFAIWMTTTTAME